jgi:uncharacterized coiled-coil DUF342 family protein
MEKESLEDLHRDIGQLRERLRLVYQKKESAYSEKEKIRQQIGTIVRQVSTLKSERDALTEKVKELKRERERLQKEKRQKLAEIKEKDPQYVELLKKHKSAETPERLQKRIALLEEKLETEAMPFSREQQLRKRIKDLQQKRDDVQQLAAKWKKYVQQSHQISSISVQVERVHHAVQKTAQESQEKHEQLSQLMVELNDFRAEERRKEEEHLHLRVEYETLRKLMKEKQRKLDMLTRKAKEKEQKRRHQLLNQKTSILDEKIKKKKKLTTNDILIFQAMEEN